MLIGMSDTAWILLLMIALFVLAPLFGPLIEVISMVMDALRPGLSAHLKTLERSLTDEDPNVRRAAADALGEMGPKAKHAASALEEVSRADEVEAVREHASRALEKIRAGVRGNTPGGPGDR